jgi:hypothetical protein
VDFESKVKGLGPGVKRVVSTGSSVMVGRVVIVNVGAGVFVRGVPLGGVLVGPCVLVANGSGVLVYESETYVTVGPMVLVTSTTAGVGCENDKPCKVEQPARESVKNDSAIFFMRTSCLNCIRFEMNFDCRILALPF